MKSYNIGIVGATGAVGIEMIKVLENSDIPIGQLKLFASARSAGKKLKFKNQDLLVKKLDKNFYEGLDFVLFSAGSNISKEYAPIAAKNNVIAIDNSSAFRMDKNIPLIVPEVNSDDLRNHKGIIANPNCTTIQLCVGIAPIYREYGIKRLIVSTYQSASGAGQKGMEELIDQTNSFVNHKPIKNDVFQHQLLFNVIPHIDNFTPNKFTKEEMKIVNETRKILSDDKIKISATAVRVPVLRCHSESVTMELKKEFTDQDIEDLLSKSNGIKVIDDIKNNSYPLAYKLQGEYATHIGRIRSDNVFDNGLSMWIVADQLLKGAALNAVQILEKLI